MFRRDRQMLRRGSAPRNPRVGGRVHLDRKRERPLLAGLQRADANDLASDFLASVVSNRNHDGILPCLTRIGMTNRAFDPQRRERRRSARRRTRIEAQVLSADGTGARAGQDHCPTMGARARRTRRRLTRRAHDEVPVPSVNPDF